MRAHRKGMEKSSDFSYNTSQRESVVFRADAGLARNNGPSRIPPIESSVSAE